MNEQELIGLIGAIPQIANAQNQSSLMLEALISLLIEKNIITQEDFDAKMKDQVEKFMEEMKKHQKNIITPDDGGKKLII
jgi:adenine C2-methylase RlmN of 23S rRNA A2503 and tRNA A37